VVVRAACVPPVSRPGTALTKLSAAAALGAQVSGEPHAVTFAAIPGQRVSPSRRKNLRAGALHKHSVLVKWQVPLKMPVAAGKQGGQEPPGTSGAPGTSGTPNAYGRTERYEVRCTSPACTIYDVAAAYPVSESLIVINSLLETHAGRRKALPEGHALRGKGKYARHLNMKAVSDILKAKTPASFRAQALHYRQDGLRLESAAALFEESLMLVWKNRGRRGVRNALLALLHVTDRCESAGESRCSASIYESGYEQPYRQIEFINPSTGQTTYRVDGAWDLRSPAQRKRKPFVQRIVFGGTAPPGSRPVLLFEFDGKIKYEDEKILDGRSKGDVLEEQNKREAELRAMEIGRASCRERVFQPV
jgi:hypothetical protein